MADDLSLIQQVLVRYANAIDELDFAALATVFTPDARASYNAGPWLEGLDAIIGYVRPLGSFAASFHLMGNMQIASTVTRHAPRRDRSHISSPPMACSTLARCAIATSCDALPMAGASSNVCILPNGCGRVQRTCSTRAHDE